MNHPKDSTDLFPEHDASFYEHRELVEARLSELSEKFVSDGTPDFLHGAREAVRAICQTAYDVLKLRIKPSIGEGDDGCPCIVYHNRRKSISLSLDVSRDGGQLLIWKVCNTGADLVYTGKLKLRELENALRWVSPPESHRGNRAA